MTDAGLDASKYAFFCSNTWWEHDVEVPAVEAVEAQDAVYDDDGNLVSEAVEAVEAREAYLAQTSMTQPMKHQRAQQKKHAWAFVILSYWLSLVRLLSNV